MRNHEQASSAQASIATAEFGTLTNRGAIQVIALAVLLFECRSSVSKTK